MSPYGFANFGVAFGLGLSIIGAAWGIWLTGSSLVGAAVKAPRIRSKNLIRCVVGTRNIYVVHERGSIKFEQEGIVCLARLLDSMVEERSPTPYITHVAFLGLYPLSCIVSFSAKRRPSTESSWQLS